MTASSPVTFRGPPLDAVEGIGPLTFGAFLAEIGARHGPNEAIVFDDQLDGGTTVRWSYADLVAASQEIAASLVAHGVAPGERVAILMGNRPEVVASIFGAAMIGAVAAPMSTFSTRPELEQLLDLCSARFVLTQRALLGRRFGDELTALGEGSGPGGRVAVVGTESWDTFRAAASTCTGPALQERCARVVPDDPALVIFSSGTTATPKGVLHSNRAPTLQFWLQSQVFGRDHTTRMFSALPVFWTAGLNTAVGSTLAAGGCWVAQETFDPAGALALIERERVTEPYTLPHQTVALSEHPDWAGTDLSSVRCAFGKGAYARHPSVRPDPGWIMPVGYGMSETCAFVSGYPSGTPREQMKVGNGPLLPGTQLRVIDPESGRALGVDEEGELAVSGETLMIGYLGRDPADCVDADGFFRTGDAGHVDADGILHWSGRRTEMIKTGGANVSPAEIEVALRACPSVKLSRVLGVPDPRLDQLVVAAVVPADGATVTEAEVQSFLRERVATYKVPKRVVFFSAEEVPMTSGGTKVRDDELLTLVLERLARDVPTDVPVTNRRQEPA